MTVPHPLIRGVSPVLETPFGADESVDVDGFGRIVEHVLATGVTSVMFPGFASEFLKLSDAERHELQTALLARTAGRDDVAAIVSIPEHATLLACRHAARAVEDGADAINLLPPYQLGPTGDAVRAHLTAVLDAVFPAPVVLQYAPAQTGTALDPGLIATIAADHGNLAFVKVEATPPGRLIAALRDTSPSVPALVGYGGLQLMDALRRGAVGVQPGCSFTELYLQIWAKWESGDLDSATVLHTRMVPYLSYWMQSVELIVAAEKLVSMRRGLTRSPLCRRPAYSLDAEETSMIDRFLAEFATELPTVAA